MDAILTNPILRRAALLLAAGACLGALLAAAGCSRPAGAAGAGRVHKVAYMICNSEEETLARFGPLTQYLADATGVPMEPVVVDTIDFEDTLRDSDIEFAHGNSLLYVILRERLGVEVLSGELRGKYGNKSTGVLFVRKDSPIQTIEDLHGKRLAFGPNLAPFGFLAQYDLLERAGIDPEDDLAFYAIPWGAYKHEKVAYGVAFGAYDVGAIPELDLERWEASGLFRADEFRIVARSELAPYCTFMSTKHADEGLKRKFQKALFALRPETTAEWRGERLRVLDRAWIDGFVPVGDGEYDGLRAMAKRANMPPYQVM